ncbi:MAG TPA: phosphate/phosphite/phosphonate ABC transporter substrate-binding protein [Gammaproteobacteria bacterium]|nr:phosphate/phosphite/phosphonate ABC transporter substrate-binding protein [Gammaproteobacteria bacterium]
MFRFAVWLPAAVFVLTGVVSSPAVIADNLYRFGVVPQQAAAKLARLWGPVMEYLSAKSGLNIQFATAPHITEFEHRLEQGRYDFAYMNPAVFADPHRATAYHAIARDVGNRLQGVVVVRKDSPVRTVAELDGLTLAFPSSTAFAASLVPRAELKARGVRVTPRYVRSHDSVYYAVARGLYPAGGGVRRTLESVAPDIRAALRVLYVTQSYTPHAFAVHERVSPADAGRVQQALMEMAGDPQGRVLLQTLHMKRLGVARDQDWDDVRALDFSSLDAGAR